MSLLTVTGLYKNFSGLEVLNGVDLRVEEEEIHAIIGPNGAGKSTLFNVITGKYKPSGGSITFNGEDITGLPPNKITYKGIARSFQILNIFPQMTVYENVRNAVVSKLNRRFRMTHILRRDKEVARKTHDTLMLMDLIPNADVPVSLLSYGQKREVEIALTLAMDPKLIMLDEPTSGLNKTDTRRIIDLIRRVTKGKTIIIIEHDMNVVFDLADRISVLYYGAILAVGSRSEIRNNEEVRKAYLGMKDDAA